MSLIHSNYICSVYRASLQTTCRRFNQQSTTPIPYKTIELVNGVSNIFVFILDFTILLFDNVHLESPVVYRLCRQYCIVLVDRVTLLRKKEIVCPYAKSMLKKVDVEYVYTLQREFC